MTVLIAIACVLAVILVPPLFIKKTHHVQREININVPNQKAFDYLRVIGNHDRFNKWAKAGERQEEYRGIDGTEGFVYAWNGNKDAGAGEKEIKRIIEGKLIETEIRFTKPFKVVAHFNITTETLSSNQTKVGWSNTSSLKYPLNIFVPMIERSLAKDMDESLRNLKSILESTHNN